MNEQSKLSIGIDDIGIADALARWPLVVPPNQRRYAWDEEYVSALVKEFKVPVLSKHINLR